MGDTTAISWTDHTFNPWMGCTEVSPACDHCYARTINKRTGLAQWGDDAPRVVTSAGYWRNPGKWNERAGSGEPGVRGLGRHLVFCASMADVFEDRAELDVTRARLFDVIAATPHLDWQLLTKRPENVRSMAPFAWTVGSSGWPDNVWIGTTVEDQERAEERLQTLLRIPAPVRFLSCEPLLGPVHIDHALGRGDGFVNWVIAGGESGPGHRLIDLDHARSLRDQCDKAGVPFFFKQVGGQHPHTGGDQLDGQVLKAFPTAVHR